MRVDSRGFPDICREQFTPVSEEAQQHIRQIKLTCNSLIGLCKSHQRPMGDAEVNRLLQLAVTYFENGSMWAVKALTSEDMYMNQKPTAASENDA